MKSEKEREITRQLLRSRFDAFMQQNNHAAAQQTTDMAWQMGYKVLAAQMVLMLDQTHHD